MNKYFRQVEKTLLFPEDSQPFCECHASNICHLKNGVLLAVWFAGTKEGEDDVGIWISRKINDVWSVPKLAAHDTDEPHWNPVLFEREDGVLLLFYKVGKKIPYWQTMIRESYDHGQLWSAERELVPGDHGGRGPVRCKVLTLTDGSILAGASTEEKIWISYGDRSIDGGKTWVLSEPVSLEKRLTRKKIESMPDVSAARAHGVIQPALWESQPGYVHMLLRSSEGEIYRADSQDYGVTWSEPYTIGLPNNNSGIDVVKTDQGLLVLCMNPVSDNWGMRVPIVLMISEDNGITWEMEMVLEDWKSTDPGVHIEYSYPSIISIGKELHITYTYNRKSITYHRLILK